VPDAASIKIVKAISWRGGIQEWSNRYHFTNGVPADNTKWTTLADAIVAAERLCFKSWIPFKRAVGYAGGSEVPVFQKDYAVSGSATTPAGDVQAPEVAALVRYNTAKRTSKNHPVYLFNYYHGVYTTSATNPDWLENNQKGLLDTYAAAWIAGFSDGSVTHRRCGPDETLATLKLVESYVTHRDFR
jgi:hypothetical protein